MKKSLFVLLALIVFVGSSVKAQQDLFLKKEFVYKNDTLKYRILFPENYDKNQKYPLVIFLHGAGERGNDNESQLVHGSSLFLTPDNRKNFPAIVVFPQCPKDKYWAPIIARDNGFTYPEKAEATEPMQLVLRLIKELKKNEAVDSKSMYVTGLSMGGMGTFDLISRYPKMFAAAQPICGGINPARLEKLGKMPIRIFHGTADNVVSPEHSKEAYNKLKEIGNTKASIILYEGVGHNSWTNVFAEPDYLRWMFANKLK
jgi:predicted peptidase